MGTKSGSPETPETAGDKTRVLARAYEILMAINNHPDGLTLREICNYSRLPRSTVQRILGTLEMQNMVITAPSTGLYRLGPTLQLFAANVRPFDIAQIARPVLMQIANRTQESVYLCVVAHSMAVVVDLIRGTYPMRTITTMGTSLPMHATACGKALLAVMPPGEVEALRPHLKLTRLTARTITDWDQLQEEFARIRATGVALDHEEHQMGTSAIAIPLAGPGGELGTISIPMPTERFQALEPDLIDGLLSDTLPLRWRAPEA